MRFLPLLVPAALLLAGCTGEPSVADCGLALAVPARAIDEGWRYDVTEVVGDPRGIDVLGYRFLNASAEHVEPAYQGIVMDIEGESGNRTLRFIDQEPFGLMGVGDAFVLREGARLVLQVTLGSTILGSSEGCA